MNKCIINIFIVVMPVLSTWEALSSSQEDTTTPLPTQCQSTTRPAGSATYDLYSRGDGAMAVVTSTMRREPR